MLHKARNLIQRQRTMLINALRAHMAELGVVGGTGAEFELPTSSRSSMTRRMKRSRRLQGRP